MGFGNAVLVRNNPANREVTGDNGFVFNGDMDEVDLAAQLQRLIDSPELVEAHRRLSPDRIRTYYNWEWIVDFYEDAFHRMLDHEALLDYDEFLLKRSGAVPTESCNMAGQGRG
jgi:glycosyltransferase involved in cell wall biosynthesis